MLVAAIAGMAVEVHADYVHQYFRDRMRLIYCFVAFVASVTYAQLQFVLLCIVSANLVGRVVCYLITLRNRMG